MTDSMIWLAQERLADARRQADQSRLAGAARHRGGPTRSLLRRIRGDRG